MAGRKRNVESLKPYWHNPDIFIVYEMKFRKDVIEPGTLIRVKNERSIFRFIRLVRNEKTGQEWVDLFDTTLGGWRSFYPDKIMGLYVAKKSRAKRKK